MIKLNNVSKKYKNTNVVALSNININIEEGKIYGLFGRNGSGKSTLLNLIGYRLFTSSGTIMIDEELLNGSIDLSKKIHLLSDKNYYAENITIMDHYHNIKNINQVFDYANAIALSTQFDLNLNTKIKDLSVGYKSAFKLCIALSMNVNYLLLDEPINGLDANHRQLFYKLLIDYYQKHKSTIIVSSHIVDEIANIIEEVIVINEGEIIVKENVEDLLSKAFVISGKDSLVKEFIKNLNVLNVDKKDFITNAYVLDEVNDVEDSNLSISKVTLQELLIILTEKGDI